MTPPAFTDEIVAPGDPLYARLAAAARLGLLPGWQPVDFLRGDRLFTRRELAPLLEKLPSKAEILVLGTAPRGFAAGSGWQVQATKNGVTAAELSTSWRGWELSAGRKPLRWGPGWTGGMLFSDSAPPLDRIGVSKRFGSITFEQFYGQYFEPEDLSAPKDTASGTRRHLAGRRLTFQNRGPWEISAGEAIKALRLPDPVFADAERLAKRLNKSRSRLYSEALAEYVLRHDPDEVTEALNKACEGLSGSVDEFAGAAGRRILRRSKW